MCGMYMGVSLCICRCMQHQLSFSITLHFPFGDRDGTIALVESGPLHFRQTEQPGSFWDSPSPPMLFSVFKGSLAFAARFLPLKLFPQPHVHILIAGITIIFAAEDIRIIGTK